MALREMVFASLFAALMSIGGYIFLPLGPVPIVLTNFFVFLSGLVLGAFWGVVAVIIYLILGIMGMPVFAGGKSGLAHLVGPTGGYLIGFVIAAWVCGVLGNRRITHRRLADLVIASILGAIAVYPSGLAWLHYVTKMNWVKTVMVGCVPFLPGDLLKAVGAAFIALKLKDIVNVGESIPV